MNRLFSTKGLLALSAAIGVVIAAEIDSSALGRIQFFDDLLLVVGKLYGNRRELFA